MTDCFIFNVTFSFFFCCLTRVAEAAFSLMSSAGALRHPLTRCKLLFIHQPNARLTGNSIVSWTMSDASFCLLKEGGCFFGGGCGEKQFIGSKLLSPHHSYGLMTKLKSCTVCALWTGCISWALLAWQGLGKGGRHRVRKTVLVVFILSAMTCVMTMILYLYLCTFAHFTSCSYDLQFEKKKVIAVFPTEGDQLGLSDYTLPRNDMLIIRTAVKTP